MPDNRTQRNNNTPFLGFRETINSLVRHSLSQRSDWETGFKGSRTYYEGRAYDLASGADPTQTPGTGTAWVEVSEFDNSGSGGNTGGGGTTVNPAITAPLSPTINTTSLQIFWSWGNARVPQSYVIRVFDDGQLLLTDNGAGTDTNYTINGLVLDGSQITVEIDLAYTDSTMSPLSANYTTTSSVVEPSWLVPTINQNITGPNVTASWDFGSRTPQDWTLTITNTSTGTVLSTTTGNTASSHPVTGLPEDGSTIALSLAITFTDSTVKTIGTVITSGVAMSAVPDLMAFASGATVTGTVSVVGDTPTWVSASSSAPGASQSSFPITAAGFSVNANAGTVSEIIFPNAGLTSLMLNAGVMPVLINLQGNAGMQVGPGDIDWSATRSINIRDTGPNVLISDSDITPAIIEKLDLCNAPGATITGVVIGQMSSLEMLCLQAVGIGLTDAHMSASIYSNMEEFLVGFNNNVTITEATMRKMPNLRMFQCPYSQGINVTGNFFTSSGGTPFQVQLDNIDVQGRIQTQGEPDS